MEKHILIANVNQATFNVRDVIFVNFDNSKCRGKGSLHTAYWEKKEACI